ncbi:MAG: family 16 glycoside hydrolase, partial [Planctomycetota bacterium]
LLSAGDKKQVERASKSVKLSFDDASVGKLPEGWKVEGTRQSGPVATWMVQADATAPSKPNVLALTDPKEGVGHTFNLCWSDTIRFQDGEIELSFKALSGMEDQGGGPVWRVQGKDNYYICRANPLESNFRVYHVKDAKRKTLASAKLDIPSGKWHTIKIEHRGNHIRCHLNGRKLLDVKDDTFAEAGGIGLWTKADAVTSFDDLAVTQAPEKQP